MQTTNRTIFCYLLAIFDSTERQIILGFGIDAHKKTDPGYPWIRFPWQRRRSNQSSLAACSRVAWKVSFGQRSWVRRRLTPEVARKARLPAAS